MLHKTSPFKDIVRKSADNCILIDQKCLNLTYNKVTVFELELPKENVFKISSKNHGKLKKEIILKIIVGGLLSKTF